MTVAPSQSVGRRIEVSDINDLGDVDNALADFCDDQLSKAAEASGVSELTIREWIEGVLITEQGFRDHAVSGPGLAGPAVLSALAKGHFLRAESRHGGPDSYEIAHDRLVGPLQISNRRWREANLEVFQARARKWDDQARPDALLLRDEILDEAEKWAAAHTPELQHVDRDYLEASQAEREHVRSAQKRQRRDRIVAVVACVLAGLALVSWNDAQRARDEAQRAQAVAEGALADVAEAETAAREARSDADAKRLERDNALAAAEAATAEAERLADTANAELAEEAASDAEALARAAEDDAVAAAEEAARLELEALRTTDRAVVDAELLESWVPQLSSKRSGPLDDGTTWDYRSILANHRQLQTEHQALLVLTADYSTYRDPTFWVSIAPAPFPEAEDALAWCVEEDRGPSDCFAKLISHTVGTEDTTAYQSS